MEQDDVNTPTRTRWAAIGAALAVTVGSGGLMSASAAVDSGTRSVFVPITPCRVMDTRPAPDNVGPRATPINATETYAISVLGVNGNCAIPADAVGLSLNVTADNPTMASYLTVFPSDASRPTASNLNWVADQEPVPNAVTTDVSTDGRISFYNNAGTVDVLVDIAGYYVDHNHDDRYYTKDLTYSQAEADAELATKADKPTGQGEVRVPAATLIPDQPTPDYGLNLSTGRLSMLSEACYQSGVLPLPAGGTVVTLAANVADPTPVNNSTISLWRDVPGPGAPVLIASVASSGMTGDQLLTTSTISSPLIGEFDAYYVSMCGDAGIGLYDATVIYTNP